MQVADYSPRTETYSNVDGNIQVTNQYIRNRDASINATGFYPVFAKADGHASYHDTTHQTIESNMIAAQHLLSAAGTLDRRTGAYFKLRKSPQYVLEGARRFSLLLEVPIGWRADLLEVKTFAFGVSNNHGLGAKDEHLLVADRFHVAVYQYGDEAASQNALQFSRQHLR